MDNQDQTLISRVSPMEELTKYHRELTEKYKKTGTAGTPATPEMKDIISFNGYYSMGDSGAFFSIDTNMHVTTTAGISSPAFDVSFIISLNGKSSKRIPFTGTFKKISNGYHLVQKPTGVGGMSGHNLDLTFTREGLTNGATAKLTGSITLAAPGQSPIPVTGVTYNNPIFYDTYIGSYHTELFKTWELSKIAEMKPGYNLHYNYLNDSAGVLTKVPNYTYNMNMYFFSFDNIIEKGSEANKLIMGTSPSAGLVSNNMIVKTTIDKTSKVKTETLTQRSIQTIKTHSNTGSGNISSSMAKNLAQFSGYYPLSSPYKGGFICIEGTYKTSTQNDGAAVWTAKVGVSKDGESVDVYNSDENISFVDNVLSINTLSNPATNIITVTLTKEYAFNSGAGSLTNLSGKVDGKSVTSTNNLNPVPLKGFCSSNMKGKSNTKNEVTISITEDGEVTYNGHQITDITYVPVMYIAAFANPEQVDHTVVLSLGTDGQKGMACIVSNVHVLKIGKLPIIEGEITTAVWAMPNEPTQQPDGESA